MRPLHDHYRCKRKLYSRLFNNRLGYLEANAWYHCMDERVIGGVYTMLDPSFQEMLPFENDSEAPPLLRSTPASLSGLKYTDTCTESEVLKSSDNWYWAVELPWKRNATSICRQQELNFKKHQYELTDNAASLACNNWFLKPVISVMAA